MLFDRSVVVLFLVTISASWAFGDPVDGRVSVKPCDLGPSRYNIEDADNSVWESNKDHQPGNHPYNHNRGAARSMNKNNESPGIYDGYHNGQVYINNRPYDRRPENYDTPYNRQPGYYNPVNNRHPGPYNEQYNSQPATYTGLRNGQPDNRRYDRRPENYDTPYNRQPGNYNDPNNSQPGIYDGRYNGQSRIYKGHPHTDRRPNDKRLEFSDALNGQPERYTGPDTNNRLYDRRPERYDRPHNKQPEAYGGGYNEQRNGPSNNQPGYKGHYVAIHGPSYEPPNNIDEPNSQRSSNCQKTPGSHTGVCGRSSLGAVIEHGPIESGSGAVIINSVQANGVPGTIVSQFGNTYPSPAPGSTNYYGSWTEQTGNRY